MSGLGNVRLVDVRPGPARANPLINALVEQLPDVGTAWPAAERAAWLEMMEKAFIMAYGGVAGGGMTRATPAAPRKRLAGKAKAAKRRPAAAKLAVPGPAFFVDRQHFARRRGGDRILPHDIMGSLVDKRGINGDLMKIIWADDTTGIPKGLQIDITISDTED